MSTRDTDPNFTTEHRRLNNTVLVTFSSKKYKTFLFAARKKLRTENERLTSDLFINENLTQYNFSLLKLLKTERKRRSKSSLTSIASVFSFDGKVYAKAEPSSEKTHIKDKDCFENFIRSVDNKGRNQPNRK